MTTTTCPSFVDLRAFADGAVAGADPFGADALPLALRGGPVAIAAHALQPGGGRATSDAGDTFAIVARGGVALTIAGVSHTLAEGDALVIAPGQAFDWTSPDGATLITMRYTGGMGGDGAAVRIDTATTRAPSGAPLAELLIGPTPQCHNHTQFLSTDGEFMVGVWDSSPYHRRAMPYRHFELMYLVDGSVTFVDEAGRAGTFAKGDIFLVEQHAQCSWESREDVTKIFAIYRPKA
ncbi:DUF861 domain-containing protein [Novosphingobium sp. FSY-8]|uniref:DUF861 domain-containing protein n=1 Tax=Novosphingobium ovatum TaxID=1908523 RepID=A0ABW9XD35_9SPHN|nr:cupin domain-containing protein [Novosphingobium ovatum]NBC36449.1 DUF861 domain-containing protein [Novosphingobium ovatum]